MRAGEEASIFSSNPGQNVGRNRDGESHFDEVLAKNEKNFIGQWRKDYPFYKVTKNRIVYQCNGMYLGVGLWEEIRS